MQVPRNNIRELDLSIRFKHGKHTIFLFVDSMSTFSQVQEELLDILKERYPNGITSSTSLVELPSEASQIKFGVLKHKADPTQGWIPLDFEVDDHPVDKGIGENMVVAFAFATDDADDVQFEVEFPSYDEEDEEDAEEAAEDDEL
ncbi:hypothetical protein F5Y03DRAFT_377776 [Xylaria venustula]|nr:hypothetical protein F5Y03DRAFT_377776 [Xylaria venustula]